MFKLLFTTLFVVSYLTYANCKADSDKDDDKVVQLNTILAKSSEELAEKAKNEDVDEIDYSKVVMPVEVDGELVN